jgi:hypothetical protein
MLKFTVWQNKCLYFTKMNNLWDRYKLSACESKQWIPLLRSWLNFTWHSVLINKVKVKLKLSLCLTKQHTMKTYWGSGGIAPRILILGTRWKWVVSFAHRPFYPKGKSSWYPLDRRLSGSQSCSGRGGEAKNSQPVASLNNYSENFCNIERHGSNAALARKGTWRRWYYSKEETEILLKFLITTRQSTNVVPMRPKIGLLRIRELTAETSPGHRQCYGS